MLKNILHEMNYKQMQSKAGVLSPAGAGLCGVILHLHLGYQC